jgi:type I restriction enzyme M protein
MNLAIRGIEANLGDEPADSFVRDLHPDLKADYILANPPFNVSDWSGPMLRDDVRWKFGVPPVGNANYAWIQHFIHHLTANGRAGFVMANGSLTSDTNGEGKVREQLVKADLVDCIVALPGQLFFTTGIPVCLWFIDRDKGSSGERKRFGETLFIDARQMGTKISRTQIELTDDELARIVKCYHAWRGQPDTDEYADEPGFCKAALIEDIRRSPGFALTPGRYVGAAIEEEDEGVFEKRMGDLVTALRDDFAANERLTAEVTKALAAVGHEL